jgi:hypothetical protein
MLVFSQSAFKEDVTISNFGNATDCLRMIIVVWLVKKCPFIYTIERLKNGVFWNVMPYGSCGQASFGSGWRLVVRFCKYSNEPFNCKI